jgi:hypothetical protein
MMIVCRKIGVYHRICTPPVAGTVPDPLSDFIKSGRWLPAEKAQAPMVEKFKKENNLQ